MPQPTFFNDATGRLRTGLRIPIFFIGMLGLYLGLGFGAVIVGGLYWGLVRKESFDAFLNAISLPEAELVFMAWVSIPLGLAMHGWVWFCRRFLDKRDMASAGVRRPAQGWTASIGLGLLAGMVPIAICVAVLMGLGEYTAVQPGAVTGLNLLLVPALIFAAYAEEITCRGYLLQNFIDIRRPWLGMVLSNLIFWLMHSVNPHVWSSPVIALNLFLAGVLMSLAYLVSGNIWFPTALHFGWNVCQGVVFGIPVSGIEIQGWLSVAEREGSRVLLTGGEFGLEGSAVALGLVIAECALFAVLLLRAKAPVGQL